MTSNINRGYDRATSLILKCDGRWEWDDNNQTSLPISTTNLVSGQADYEISTVTFLNIIRVEMNDSSGNAIQLIPMSYNDRRGEAMTEWAKTNSTPQYYDKVGNSLILYPTPNYSSTAGLKVYYQRMPDYFTTDDTTQEPGFNPQFHRLLSLYSARDYCLVNELDNKLKKIENEIAKLEIALIEFYSSRIKDEQPRLTLAKESYDNEFGVGSENSVG